MVTRLKRKLVSFCLGIVLTLTQDRSTVCAERTIGLEKVLDAPEGTPWCVGHVKPCFGPFGDGISVSARQVQGLRQTYHRLSNHFV
jgi:hypothetical protein